MPTTISSTANPRVKQLLLLQQKSSERRRQQRILIEGVKEIHMAAAAGFDIRELFICPAYCTDLQGGQLHGLPVPPERITEISSRVFEKLAYRDSTGGVLALAEPRFTNINSFLPGENPLIIVMEAIEKPGNLGAILRSADAASADAVIVCDPLADIYGPNTIRASLGCVFSVPVIACASVEAISRLEELDIRIFAATPEANKIYFQCNMKRSAALILGAEASGLTDQWLDAADEHILIPMAGKADSLNVSVSAAILLFEAVRQRYAF
jgi:RNA methyltransferase, TrmH family